MLVLAVIVLPVLIAMYGLFVHGFSWMFLLE